MGLYKDSVLGHEMPDELARLKMLETMADPQTFAILEGIGVTPTWNCLEIGAGAGSVAVRLAGMVTSGSVVATDLDPQFLPSDIDRLSPLRHDVTVDDFPPASFDLIHARCVLEHLPDRDKVLARMLGWLAPGGWICLEGIDVTLSITSPYLEVRTTMRGLTTTMREQLGTDPGFPRRATSLMRKAGLNDIGLSAAPVIIGDGGDGDQFVAAMVQRFSPALLANGTAHQDDLSAINNWLTEPKGLDIAGVLLSAYARRRA